MIDQLETTAEVRRRRHKRYGQNGHVTMRRVITGPNLEGDLFDISLGGCLIWLDIPVRFQASDFVEVKLQAGPLTLRVMGSVRYTSEAGRILGIEFQRLPINETVALGEFVQDLEAAAALESALLCY